MRLFLILFLLVAMVAADNSRVHPRPADGRVATNTATAVFVMYERTLDNMMRDDYADEVARVMRGVRGDPLYGFNETTTALIEHFVWLIHDNPLDSPAAHVFLVSGGVCFAVITNNERARFIQAKLTLFNFFQTRHANESGFLVHWQVSPDSWAVRERYIGIADHTIGEIQEYRYATGDWTSYVVGAVADGFFSVLMYVVKFAPK